MWPITHPPSMRQRRGRKKRDRSGRGARRSLPTLIGSALGPLTREPLGTDLAPGLLALVGLLLQPSLNGLPTVPHVTAHPIADRTVTLVPPAIQGVKGDAQHFRNIRERHQLVTGLKCHHLFLLVDRSSGKVLGLPRVSLATWARSPGRSGKRLVRAARPKPVKDLSRDATAGGRRTTTRIDLA